MTDASELRVYWEVGDDGYPVEWHETIKDSVRAAAGHRCVRCGHPYLKGMGEWSPCDQHCTHDGPISVRAPDGIISTTTGSPAELVRDGWYVQAQWRILTVHHLNGVEYDCRWWNLAALCQRCHLTIQGRVQLSRVWPWEHTEWFKPYAAGWYADAYLGEDLTRREVLERLDELLALERIA